MSIVTVTVSVWASEEEAVDIVGAYPQFKIQEDEWHGASYGYKLVGSLPADQLQQHQTFGTVLVVGNNWFPVQYV